MSDLRTDPTFLVENLRGDRHALATAEQTLWQDASMARSAGATLAEIANATGFAIETVRRKLAATDASLMASGQSPPT